jgi:hypothetical protein
MLAHSGPVSNDSADPAPALTGPALTEPGPASTDPAPALSEPSHIYKGSALVSTDPSHSNASTRLNTVSQSLHPMVTRCVLNRNSGEDNW